MMTKTPGIFFSWKPNWKRQKGVQT